MRRPFLTALVSFADSGVLVASTSVGTVEASPKWEPAAAPTYTAELSSVRDRGNADVSGVLSPACEGRPVALQYLSGRSWKAVGSPVNEDAAGTKTAEEES
jgi:hypothetical protein